MQPGSTLNGNVSLDLSGGGDTGTVNITTGGTTTIAGELNSNGDTININTLELDVTAGTLNAGSSTVAIAPSGNQAVFVGGTPQPGTLNISVAELSSITASNIVIGSQTVGSNLTVADDIDVSGLTSTLTLNSPASVIATGQTLTIGSNNLTLNGADVFTGSLSGNGASVVYNATSGNIHVDGTITIENAGTPNGAVTLNAVGIIDDTANIITAGNLTTTSTGSSTLQSAATNLVVNVDTGATMSVTQSSDVTLHPNTLIGGSLILNAGANDITVAAGVPAVEYETALTIVTNGALLINNSGTLRSDHVDVTAGSVTLESVGNIEAFGPGATLTISTTNNGSITNDGDIDAGANNVTLNVNGTGTISGGGIIRGHELALNLGTGNASVRTNVDNLSATAGAPGVDLSIDETDSISIGSMSNINNLSVPSAEAVTFATTNNFANDLTITADAITVIGGVHVTAQTVTFTGFGNSSAMHVNNYGTVESTVNGIAVASSPGQDLVVQGDHTSTGSYLAAAGTSIDITATDSGTFHPNLLFTDLNADPNATTSALTFGFAASDPANTVNLTANGQPTNFIEFQSGIVQFDNTVSTLNFNCCNVVMNTADHAMFIADPATVVNLNCPAGTIANSSGDIDLSLIGTLTFTGQNLTILSFGSIINSGADKPINISSPIGAGGSLLLIAGFGFTPATAGTVYPPDSTVYTITGTNPAGGNIDLGNVTINTTGTTDGGSVQAYANGSVVLSEIDTHGNSGSGGAITIVGGGVTLGTVTATGATGNGALTITAANAIQMGGETLVAGKIVGENFLQPDTTLTGDVNLTGGSAGTINVTTGAATRIIGVLNSNNGDITINTATFNMTGGFLNAGVGTLTIAPSGSQNIILGGAPVPGALNISPINLGNIAASSVVIGSQTVGGNLTVGANLNLIALPFALTLNSPSAVTATGFTINLGTNPLVVNGQTVHTGSVTGDGANVTYHTTTGDIFVDGTISVLDSAGTPNGVVTIAAGGAIHGDNLISSGRLITTSTGDSTLLSGASNLVVNLGTSDTITVAQSQSVIVGANTGTGGSLAIDAGANNVTFGPGVVQYAQGVTVATADSNSVTVNGMLQANNASITTGDIDLSLGAISTVGGTTTIKTSGNSISLNGSGDLDLSTAELANITAAHLVIGDTIASGPVTVGSISIASAPYDLTLNSAISVDASGGTIALGTHDLTVNAAQINTGTVIGDGSMLTYTAGSGGIEVDGNITISSAGGVQNGSVSMSTTGAIDGSGGVITTDSLTTSSTGASTLQTAVNSLTIDSTSAAASMTVTQTGALLVNDVSLANFNLTADANVTFTGTTTVSGTTNLTGSGNAGFFTTSTGSLVGGGILTITAATGDIGGTGGTFEVNVAELTVHTAGNVGIHQTGAALLVHSMTGNNVSLIGQPGIDQKFTFAPDSAISANNDLLVQTNNVLFQSGATMSGTTVSISNFPTDNFPLTVSGNASVQSQLVAIVQSYSPASGTPVNNLFIGDGITPTNLSFSGPGLLNLVSTGVVQIAANAQVNNSGNIINVFSNGITLLNPSGLNGPVAFTALSPAGGIIGNPNGDVILPQNLTFFGQNLAIVASGNILASTRVNSINLSSKTGNGGNLLLIAGYDFEPLVAGQLPALDPAFKLKVPGVYVLDGPSASGGSILLPKVNINTSTTFTGTLPDIGTGDVVHASAGTVTAIAHGPAGLSDDSSLNLELGTNSGAIALGNITATGVNTRAGWSDGGAVLLIGQGGVQTGNIKTTGHTGGSVTITGAEPAVVPNTSAQIINGVLAGPVFTNLAPSNSNGAAINVNGTITTTGLALRAGDVKITADQQVEIKTGIVATGIAGSAALPAGGNVDIQSTLASITIGRGGINTSGLNVKLDTAGGNAGDILLHAENAITSGSLKAVGANNTGNGNAGRGGNITITMNDYELSSSSDIVKVGATVIKGFVDAHGGNAAAKSTTVPTALGGDGGVITVDSGSILITGMTGGISVNAKGGIGRGGTAQNGNAGSVSMQTYTVQQLPTNLDLTSKTAKIATTPGGMFTIGLSGAVNGVAGRIAAAATVTGKDVTGFGPIAGEILSSSPSGALFNPTGSNISISINGDATGSVDAITGKRVLLTPANAVVEFQTERGQAPITVDPGTGVATGGTFTFSELDANGIAFTGFKLPTNINANVTGNRPMLIMPASTLFNGTLNFITPVSPDAPDAIAYVNFGAGALKIGTTGAITGDPSATLILSGTAGTWTNSGELSAGNLVFAHASTRAFTFTGNLDSRTSAAGRFIIAPSVDPGMSMSFKSLGATTFLSDYEIGNVLVPTGYKPNAVTRATTAATPPALKLTFALALDTVGTLTPLTPNLTSPLLSAGGVTAPALSVKTITITGSPVKAKLNNVSSTVQTQVHLGTGINMAATGAVTVSNTLGQLTLDNGAQLISTGGAVTVKTTNGAISLEGAVLNGRKGLTISSSKGVIGIDNSQLTAGLLNITPPLDTSVANFPNLATIAKNQIANAGTINITSGATGVNAVVFGSGNTLNSNGGNINVKATAIGGNTTMGSDSFFTALAGNVSVLAKGNVSGATGNTFQALGTVNTANGAVEIGSGSTSSTISAAFGKKPVPVVPAPGALGTVDITQPQAGNIIVTNKNVSAGSLSLGTGTAATLDLTERGVMVFTNGSATSTINFSGGTFQTNSDRPIAFLSPATSGMTFGEDSTANDAPIDVIDSQDAMLRTNRDGVLVLHRGEVFLEATGNAAINIVHGFITAGRGAIVHIVANAGKVYVKACSNGIVVHARGTDLRLAPGQEVLLSSEAPRHTDLHPSDGVGRRRQNERTLADGMSVVISDFSMISLIANLPNLRFADKIQGRKIIERILKTAAAVETVTRARGAYTATPRSVTHKRGYSVRSASMESRWDARRAG